MHKNVNSKEEFIKQCINEAANGGSITYVWVSGMPYDETKNFCYVNFLESWFDSEKNAVSADVVCDALNGSWVCGAFGMKMGAHTDLWNLQLD